MAILCYQLITAFVLTTVLLANSSGHSKSKDKPHSLDPSSLHLRRDLLDVATEFFQGLKNMLVDGDLDEYKTFAYNLLDDSFVFPSDLSGVTFYGLDEFLDETDGWHVNIIGTFDVVTSTMASNIIYRGIDKKTVEMEFPVRTLLWRNECPQNGGLQGIIEEEIDILRLQWSESNHRWKILSFINQGGKLDKIICSAE